MENLTAVQWVVVVLGCLLAVSEVLPFTAAVKANGIFQAVINVLKMLVGKKS